MVKAAAPAADEARKSRRESDGVVIMFLSFLILPDNYFFSHRSSQAMASSWAGTLRECGSS